MSTKQFCAAVLIFGFLDLNVNAGTITADKVEAEVVLVKEIGLYQSNNNGILYYPFECDEFSGVSDSGTGGYDAAASGCVWINSGPYGGSMYFDGFGDYIDVGAAPNFPIWSQYSVSVWFNHNGGGDFGPNYGHKILDKTMFYHDWHLSVRPETGHLLLTMYEGGSSGLWAGDINYMDSCWHHAVIVRNAGYGELWVDGALKSTTATMRNVYSRSDLCVGNSFSTDYYQRKAWSGMLDELRIYDYPLSSAEIARLYSENLLKFEDAPDCIVVTTNLIVTGGITTSGSVSFAAGVSYSKPLGGLSSGIYTNTP